MNGIKSYFFWKYCIPTFPECIFSLNGGFLKVATGSAVKAEKEKSEVKIKMYFFTPIVCVFFGWAIN